MKNIQYAVDMAETGPDFSEEVVLSLEKKKEPEINRRQVLAATAGGIGSILAYLVGKNNRSNASAAPIEVPIGRMERGSDELLRRNEDAASSLPKTVEDLGDIQDEYYQSLTPEQKRLVDETSAHLSQIYGSIMDERHYPSEEAKRAFWRKVTEIGLEISPENSNFANQLAAVMAWESGFSPDIPSNNGSDGIGLIQFSNEIPANLRTTHEALASMTPLEQLDYVATYYRNKRDDLGVEFFTLEDVYAAVIAPQTIGQGPDAVLYEKGTKFAEHNKAIDEAGDSDGNLTLKDATKAVYTTAISSGESPEYLSDPRST